MPRGLHAVMDRSGSQDDAPLDPRQALTALGEIVYDWDIAGDALSFGPNLKDLIGREPGSLATGRAFALCIEPGSGRSPHDTIAELGDADRAAGVPFRTRYLLRTAPDRLFAVEDLGRCFAGADGRPSRAHGVLHVRRLSRLDDYVAPEAALSQRAALIRRLDEEVAAARGSGRSVAIVAASILGLTELNEAFGEDEADIVIRTVGARFNGALRGSDSVSRYAGNRFGAILASCSAEQVAQAASRFQDSISGKPVATALGPLTPALAMGAAVFPLHGADGLSLVRCAEDALRHAKAAGEGFALFDRSMRRDPRETAAGQRHELICALNERRVVLALQPVVDARTRDVAFHEGLIRIVGSEGQLVGAHEIVPQAEKLGVIKLLDARVLELAAEHLSVHPAARLSVNVSPLSLADPAWLEALAAHVGARPGIAERLMVEITETAAVDDPEALTARLNCMKALGVTLGIDDFGSGHTSFRHLRRFPVDFVKIDGAFVQNLAISADDRFFVRTLVDLAQNLGIATVAEWVESEDNARVLAEWGVDYLQGDLIGRPAVMAPAEAGAALRDMAAAARA